MEGIGWRRPKDTLWHAHKLAAYHAWMASPLKPSTARGPPHLLPWYLQLELGRHVLRNIARFCLRAHTLRVETGCWQIHNRHCDKCDLCTGRKTCPFSMPMLGNVPYEKEIRRTICWFYQISRSFLSWQHKCRGCDVCFSWSRRANHFFLSLRLDIFGLAGSAQQAQQSTHLAEGLTHFNSAFALAKLRKSKSTGIPFRLYACFGCRGLSCPCPAGTATVATVRSLAWSVRGTCDGRSIIHLRSLWVRGSNLTRGSQPAKLPSFGRYSLENLVWSVL